ncbi:MAG TPA: DUF2911 domain-containing protein [Gemmatimonadaceae bacterium]|jgi:hypothetical protein|nr:DUF2911 domain-containing protein [Gemmatimonadaceae bacterium]
MFNKIISIACLFLVSASVAAQNPAPSYLVTRLGVDTVGIERFTRTNNRVEGDLVLRYPRVRTFHYVADVGPRGEIRSLTTVVTRPGTPAAAPPLLRAVSTFGDSVAVFQVERNGKADTAASGRKVYHGGVVPTFFTEPPMYGLYEQALASAKLGRDSVSYALLGPGSGPVPAITIRRRGADSVAFTSSFFPGWTEVARVDSRGRLTGIDATATTVKTVAERVPNLDYDGIVSRWAAYEASKGGAIGQMSPPDTVRANVDGANITVAYSRPLKRGRVIFGNIVPWNQVWRTGANAATMFTTDKDLVFGNTVVPAGKYTLWTLPTPSGAKLIINSETGQWGTDYHAEKDFARVDLTSNKLSQPQEEFEIGVVPEGTGGLLRMAWDDREYSIPFTVK